jgi:thiol-disulfide isomerase/thioredoxin
VNRRLLTVPALVVLAGTLVGCAGAGAVQNGPGGGEARYVAGNGVSEIVKDRKPAPAVQGTTLDGKPLKLADFSGKITVINFWASWCAPCRAEAPTMQKVYDETKASGVQFVGVDIKDGKDNAQAFLRTFKVTYPSLYDQAGQTALAFRDIPPNAVPSTLVIDRRGNIAARAIGSVSYSPLKDIVTRLAAEK